MAAVHFTTIPRESYTAHKIQGKPPVLTALCMLGLKILELFCTFF